MKVVLKNGEECQELSRAYTDLGVLMMRGLPGCPPFATWGAAMAELAEFSGASLSYDNSGSPVFDHGNVSDERSQALRTGLVKSAQLEPLPTLPIPCFAECPPYKFLKD